MAAKSVNRLSTAPVKFPRSRRNHSLAVLTSMPAGKIVPLAAIPMLREDGFRASFRTAVEMLETKEILMNPVNLRVSAYCVPWLALERFEGSRDQFDRSYAGLAKVEGGASVDFFETHAFGALGAKEFYKYLGLHAKSTDLVNTAYLEAYNSMVNFRRKQRSPDLPLRTRLQDDLAEAFWQHSRFDNVVPDFDQAVIDGEVALNVVNAKMPVHGFGTKSGTGAGAVAAVKQSGAVTSDFASAWVMHDAARPWYAEQDPDNVGFPNIWAELQDNGITVSLSNIAAAKQTQAFARLRERYDGFDDEYIIDMLMGGLTIPDQALKQPILLGDQTVRFAQAKRYATDSGNLAESAVSGGAVVDMTLRVPQLNTGGVVLIVAEAIPEQLFERQRDAFFTTSTVEALPEALRDTLDPEKVDIVTNADIDSDHATPTGTFGYAPMNWKWNAAGPKVGGKFYRPAVDGATDTDRQRLWAVEAIDPALSADFYIVSAMHTKPFLDPDVDPFEATVVGNAVLDGNTQFGGLLVEATGNYDAVAAKVPQERIDTTP